MHSNSILTSNLLDIIFENRNKDYGAYVLRKEYNKRLFCSLGSVLGLVIVLSFWQMLIKQNITPGLNIASFIPKPSITRFKQIENEFRTKTIHPLAKPAKGIINKPLIVSDKTVIATAPNDPVLMVNPTDNMEGPPAEPGGTGAVDGKDYEIKKTLSASLPEIHKDIISSPEVLPAYPGGISELIKFLKKNLHTPEDMQEGENIAVRVKFIVSYDGNLTGFDIVESGGPAFDNEVIRVLKKMQKWIPGKTAGKNVSAYFVIPVTFKSD